MGKSTSRQVGLGTAAQCHFLFLIILGFEIKALLLLEKLSYHLSHTSNSSVTFLNWARACLQPLQVLKICLKIRAEKAIHIHSHFNKQIVTDSLWFVCVGCWEHFGEKVYSNLKEDLFSWKPIQTSTPDTCCRDKGIRMEEHTERDPINLGCNATQGSQLIEPSHFTVEESLSKLFISCHIKV
jgi:hypothetical protein